MGNFRGNRLAKKGKVWYFTSTVNQGQKLDPCLSTQAMADYWCCFETRNPVLSCKKALFGPVSNPTYRGFGPFVLIGAVANLQYLRITNSGGDPAIDSLGCQEFGLQLFETVAVGAPGAEDRD